MPHHARRVKALLTFLFVIFFGITATGCELTDADSAGSKAVVSEAEIEDGAANAPESSSDDEGSSAEDSDDSAGTGEKSKSEDSDKPKVDKPESKTDETGEGTGGAPSKIDGEDKPKPAAGSALATAKTLTVKGRAPKTGYSRDQFGPAWKDIDANGCDQRNDILNRDLTNITHKAGTNGCIVLTGTLIDPFSGKKIDFERGQKTSHKVQIDHVVALSDAWQKGAQQWDFDKRLQFANDPLNLLAVDGPLNAQKGDGDAATWLPPNKAFRCQYVAQLVGVKHAYSLWVTQAEQDAMVRVLSSCPQRAAADGQDGTEGDGEEGSGAETGAEG